MEDFIMPETWVSIAEAAARLRVHPRTIERRMQSGKVTHRRADNGMVQVMIELPDPPAGQSPDALSVVADQAESQVQLAVSATSAIVRQSQTDAAIARHDAERAWQETVRVRRNSTYAWTLVAMLTVGSMIAIGYTSHVITRESGHRMQLTSQLETSSDSVGQLSRESATLREQLATERQARYLAEGQVKVLNDMVALARDEARRLRALERASHEPAQPSPSTQPGESERLMQLVKMGLELLHP
jgi:hypothetical protein